MKKFKNMLPYLILNALAFYLSPFLIKDTGSGIWVLLVAVPLICFALPFAYGVKNSFNPAYFLVVAALFAPTVFIFYNESAAVYIAVYAVVSAVGNFLGKLFYRKDV